jgi:hypothetical protein
MIDINLMKTTLLTNLLYTNKADKYLLFIDLTIAVFSVLLGISFFEYLVLEVVATSLIKVTFAVVQTNRTIRYQIKNDAVQSVNKLFKYKR